MSSVQLHVQGSEVQSFRGAYAQSCSLVNLKLFLALQKLLGL